jgi:hypothetical protein
MVSFKEFFFIEAGLEHRPFNKFKQLEEIANKLKQEGIPEANIWITFTNVPRISIWPRTENKEQETPMALYGYPIKIVIDKNTDFSYFASKRPYIVVFIVNEDIKDIGIKDKNFDVNQYKIDIDSAKILESVYRSLPTEGIEEEKCLKEIYEYLLRCRHFAFLELLHSTSQAAFHAKQSVCYEAFCELKGKDSIFGGAVDEVYGSVHHSGKFWVQLSTETIEAIKYNPKFNFLLKYIKSPLLYGKDAQEFDALVRKPSSGIDPSKINESKLFEKAKSLVTNFKAEYDRVEKEQLTNLISKDFPKKKGLMEIANEYDLNIGLALSKATDIWYLKASEGSVLPRNKDEFVYRVTEELARQWARQDGKDGHWPGRWRRLLMRLGYSSIADLQHSGAIHRAEPTQGAFFDTSKLEMITVIRNLPYMSDRFKQNSVSEKLPDDTEMPILQDKSIVHTRQSSTSHRYEDSPERKAYKGLLNKATERANDLRRTITTIKSYPIDYQYTISLHGFRKSVNAFIASCDWILRNSPGILDNIKQIIDIDPNKVRPEFHSILNSLKSKIREKEQSVIGA